MKKAEETLAIFADAARASTDARVDMSYIWAASTLLARSGHQDRLEAALAAVSKSGTGGGAGGAGCHATSTYNAGIGDPQARVDLALARTRALAAATRGDARELARQEKIVAAQLAKLASATYGPGLARGDAQSALQARAQLAAAKKRWAEAEALLRKRIAMNADNPFRGAADPAGQAAETLLGDVLLAAKQPKQAAAAYAEALRVTPADSLALLGAARAARALGDEVAAAGYYRKLRAQWENADPDFPALAEVRAGAELAAGPRD